KIAKKEGSNKPSHNQNQKHKQGKKGSAQSKKHHVTKKNKSHGGNKNQQPPKQEKQPAAKTTPEKITYSDVLTVGELAEKLNKDANEIIKKLMFYGVMATKNQDLDDDSIELICDEYHVELEKEIILEDTDFEKYKVEDNPKDLQ